MLQETMTLLTARSHNNVLFFLLVYSFGFVLRVLGWLRLEGCTMAVEIVLLLFHDFISQVLIECLVLLLFL